MAKEIVTTYGALSDVLMAQPDNPLVSMLHVRLDEQLRYHLLKLQRLVLPEFKEFTARLDAIITELGAERPPTGAERAKRGPAPIMAVKPENIADYMKRLNDLRAVKVTIPWGPITREMVKDHLDITGADLLNLGPLFELDPPTDEKE